MILQKMIKNAIAWIHYLAKKQSWELYLLWLAYLGIMALPLLILQSEKYDWDDIDEFYYTCVPLAHGIIWGVMVFFYGIGSVENDINSRMIESHRLMPMTGQQIILGYIGSILAAVAPLGLFNFVVGIAVFSPWDIALHDWWVANALLVVYVPFLCMSALFMRMICGRKIATLIALGILVFFGWYLILMIFPAITLIAIPWLQLIPGYEYINGDMPLDQLRYYYVLSILYVISLTIILFMVCVRKYRQPRQTWLSPAISLVFFGIWVLATKSALEFWLFTGASFYDDDGTMYFSLGLISCFLMVCLPLSSAGWHKTMNLQANLLQDTAPRQKSLPVWLSSLISAVLIFIFMIMPHEKLLGLRLDAFAILLSACLALGYWIQLGHTMRISTISMVILWFIAVYGLPYSLGFQFFSPYNEIQNFAVLSPSPLAALTYLPEMSNGLAVFSVILHACMALVVFLMYRLRIYFIKSTTDPGSVMAAITSKVINKAF